MKIIKSYVPEKVKLYIQKNLLEELKYFQKKYLFRIEIISDEKLMVPEFKIELLNKTKKVINIVERIDYIPEFKRKNNSIIDDKKDSKKIKKRHENRRLK